MEYTGIDPLSSAENLKTFLKQSTQSNDPMTSLVRNRLYQPAVQPASLLPERFEPRAGISEEEVREIGDVIKTDTTTPEAIKKLRLFLNKAIRHEDVKWVRWARSYIVDWSDIDGVEDPVEIVIRECSKSFFEDNCIMIAKPLIGRPDIINLIKKWESLIIDKKIQDADSCFFKTSMESIGCFGIITKAPNFAYNSPPYPKLQFMQIGEGGENPCIRGLFVDGLNSFEGTLGFYSYNCPIWEELVYTHPAVYNQLPEEMKEKVINRLTDKFGCCRPEMVVADPKLKEKYDEIVGRRYLPFPFDIESLPVLKFVPSFFSKQVEFTSLNNDETAFIVKLFIQDHTDAYISRIINRLPKFLTMKSRDNETGEVTYFRFPSFMLNIFLPESDYTNTSESAIQIILVTRHFIDEIGIENNVLKDKFEKTKRTMDGFEKVSTFIPLENKVLFNGGQQEIVSALSSRIRNMKFPETHRLVNLREEQDEYITVYDMNLFENLQEKFYNTLIGKTGFWPGYAFKNVDDTDGLFLMARLITRVAEGRSDFVPLIEALLSNPNFDCSQFPKIIETALKSYNPDLIRLFAPHKEHIKRVPHPFEQFTEEDKQAFTKAFSQYFNNLMKKLKSDDCRERLIAECKKQQGLWAFPKDFVDGLMPGGKMKVRMPKANKTFKDLAKKEIDAFFNKDSNFSGKLFSTIPDDDKLNPAEMDEIVDSFISFKMKSLKHRIDHYGEEIKMGRYVCETTAIPSYLLAADGTEHLLCPLMGRFTLDGQLMALARDNGGATNLLNETGVMHAPYENSAIPFKRCTGNFDKLIDRLQSHQGDFPPFVVIARAIFDQNYEIKRGKGKKRAPSDDTGLQKEEEPAFFQTASDIKQKRKELKDTGRIVPASKRSKKSGVKKINEPAPRPPETSGSFWKIASLMAARKIDNNLAKVKVKFDKAATLEWGELAALQDLEKQAENFPFKPILPLKPYQAKTLRLIRAARSLGYNPIMSLEVGLGKTMTAACEMLERIARGEAGDHLWISPKNVSPQSFEAIKKYIKEAKEKAIRTGGRDLTREQYDNLRNFDLQNIKLIMTKGDMRQLLPQKEGPWIIVTTNNMLERQEFVEIIKQKLNPSTVEIDEAQNFHTAGSKRSQLLQNLIGDLYRKNPDLLVIPMTGTPFENSFSELWSLLKLANPGHFSDKTLGSLINYINLAKLQFEKRTKPFKVIQAFMQLHIAAELLKPLIIHGSKRDLEVIEQWEGMVPTLKRTKVVVKQDEILSKLALRALNDCDERAKKSNMSSSNVHKNNLEISRVLIHRGFLENNLTSEEGKRKLSELLYKINITSGNDIDELIKDFPNVAALCECDRFLRILGTKEKAVVFVSLKADMDITTALLEKKFGKNIDVIPFSGSLTDSEKHNNLNLFKSDSNSRKAKILIISIKAGGAGLNLPEADKAFFLTFGGYNPGLERQAEGRIDRVGHVGTKEILHLSYNTFLHFHADLIHNKKRAWEEFLLKREADIEKSFEKWISILIEEKAHEILLNTQSMDKVATFRQTGNAQSFFSEQFKPDEVKKTIASLMPKQKSSEGSEKKQKVASPKEKRQQPTIDNPKPRKRVRKSFGLDCLSKPDKAKRMLVDAVFELPVDGGTFDSACRAANICLRNKDNTDFRNHLRQLTPRLHEFIKGKPGQNSYKEPSYTVEVWSKNGNVYDLQQQWHPSSGTTDLKIRLRGTKTGEQQIRYNVLVQKNLFRCLTN